MLRKQQEFLVQLLQISQRFHALLEIRALENEISRGFREAFSARRVLLLTLHTPASSILEFSSVAPAFDSQSVVESTHQLYFNTFQQQSQPWSMILSQGQVYSANADELKQPGLVDIAQYLGADVLHLAPLQDREKQFIGLLVLDLDGKLLLPIEAIGYQLMAQSAASSLANALHHQRIIQELANTVHEQNILQQIDAELNDTIELRLVFSTILDWALRFTNAHAATLALYDQEHDALTITAHYGYDETQIPLDIPLSEDQGGITLRVARAGKAEIVPDVSHDKDYFARKYLTRAQLCMPIFREDRVIAVLTLESQRVNGFDDTHLAFVQKLARRAGVAVDNAYLFTTTKRERQKLSFILSNIADIVVVIGPDERIILINQSAIQAFQLSTEHDYVGERFVDVIQHASLRAMMLNARSQNEDISGEVALANERIYFARISHHAGIGRIVLMQDVTHYKETDRLKNELVTTVSHDLRQPLAIMRGYIDLLRNHNLTIDDRAKSYFDALERAFDKMNELITDVLDLARIEAGIHLDMKVLDLRHLITDCVFHNTPAAQTKGIEIVTQISNSMPPVYGDEGRLKQVFSNLVNNAIKYTPNNGKVTVTGEVREDAVRVLIQDTGIGISPEDQTQVFERFWRARRPETRDIEGTGLGLAIVKSLVEAHRGQIDVTSELGKGSTFRVTLPQY